MCCRKDITDQTWFIWAVDILHWYVHRSKEGENIPPPSPPDPSDDKHEGEGA